MRTLPITIIAAALLTLLFASGALAADTQDLQVQARVVGNCAFDSATDVDFGDLDQTSGSDATSTTGDLVFWCTKNASYTLGDEINSGVGDGAFAGILTPTGTSLDTIAYTLAYTNVTGNGAGKSAPITSAVTATIANADYVNVAADTYTDTVTFTINP